MNSLWVRLTLAFIGVTLVTVIVVAVLADTTANREFRRYVAQRDQLEGTPAADSGQSVQNPPYGLGLQNGQGAQRPPGAPFGNNGRQPPGPAALEAEFAFRLRAVLVIAALVVGAMGMVLGLIISRTIAAPLATLSHAAQDFGEQDWKRRVPIRGTDEIADVARAFNAMADALERAEKLRRNLMADIAHELRTPLTVMQGNLRALLDGVYPLEMREIATLYDETRLLSRLVADLRELALAEAGQLPLNMQPVEVSPLLRAAVDQFEVVAEAQDVQLALSEKPLPVVQADPDRLAQVLHNLLANALRHTPGGKVTLSAEQSADQVRIRVDDTGEGINPTDLPFIFDRFYRAGDSQPSGSTGLGLAIAKTWVEAMGGTIGVDSSAGKGSSFWFVLKTSR
jgi:two-component system OmpR family sensor kinase/two-component system sensor histidine kinase BaeS